MHLPLSLLSLSLSLSLSLLVLLYVCARVAPTNLNNAVLLLSHTTCCPTIKEYNLLLTSFKEQHDKAVDGMETSHQVRLNLSLSPSPSLSLSL